MTTVTTVCRNCGVSADGVVRQCPECSSADLAERRTLSYNEIKAACAGLTKDELRAAINRTGPAHIRAMNAATEKKPRVPAGCECGRCEVGDNMLVVRCSGTAIAVANAGETL